MEVAVTGIFDIQQSANTRSLDEAFTQHCRHWQLREIVGHGSYVEFLAVAHTLHSWPLYLRDFQTWKR